MSEAAQTAKQKPKRDRSPSFPFISLRTAIERLEQYEKHFGRHPTPADRAGAAWGMKEQSSQADQTLAALRSFGLIQYDGTGPKRMVSLSNEARTYLRAQQESVRGASLKQAALRPRIIRQFWALWGADRPVDAVAIDALVLENAFSDNGARSFLKVYDDTVTFANLSTADKPDTEEGRIEEGMDEDNREKSDIHDDQLPPPPPANNKVRVRENERIAFTEELQPGNYLKLIASGELNDFLLEALEDFVRRQRKRLEMLARSSSYMGGSFVPVSGIYSIQHFGHQGQAQGTFKKGDMFPLCGDCSSDTSEVIYTFMQPLS